MKQARPIKRTDHFLTQRAGSELLIYDEQTHKACCLNDLAATVWSACDGSQTAFEIAVIATAKLARPVSEEVVLFTLAELRRDDLLSPETASETVVLPSRREMVRKLGLGAAVLLPVVTSIMAPKAAQAYGSSGGSGCFDCSTSTRQAPQGQSAPQQGSGSGGGPSGFPQ